ncbi:hypothetical protein EYC84_003794 [Monilinia fructicola]|uniref:Uncharacterized protein n=1 Tax=Monilinia fructicola TaxID=38448 RepID=A0A5M9JZK1_MONFR|nr:hypothetical protein EYC84_003794 [Monilinia fructicola]
MSWKNGNGEWELPKFKDAHQFLVEEFWSVKFYPYNKPGVDPIYAVVGGKHIVICRPPTEENGVEVIRLIMDEEPSADHYTCCWTKDLATKTPLLCVAGVDAKIKIFDVLSGKLVRVLIGHGGEIDELTISPINPHILASCSTDSTIRIWSLDPTHKDFPCAAILTGGHKDTVTTIDFHHSGRYLISGGVDHMICLLLRKHEAANASSTLTCFTDPSRFDSYVRIIEFSAPETETFWIRFSLFQGLPIPPSPNKPTQAPTPL